MASVVQEVLTPSIGKLTARKAVELVARRCQVAPEQLDASHNARICEVLQPVLRTLVGRATAERVIEQVRAQLIRGGA